jgi:HPt (histidine-containing phosphotransfer) domain-containing protein
MTIDKSVWQELRDLDEGGDSLLMDMAKIFCDTVPKMLEEIRQGIAAGNFEDIGALTHSLKSTAANLGAFKMRDHCEKMEIAAKAGRAPELQKSLPELESETAEALKEITGLLT